MDVHKTPFYREQMIKTLSEDPPSGLSFAWLDLHRFRISRTPKLPKRFAGSPSQGKRQFNSCCNGIVSCGIVYNFGPPWTELSIVTQPLVVAEVI